MGVGFLRDLHRPSPTFRQREKIYVFSYNLSMHEVRHSDVIDKRLLINVDYASEIVTESGIWDESTIIAGYYSS